MKNFFSNIAHLGFIGLYTFGYIGSGGISSLDYETNVTIFIIGFCLACYVPYFIAENISACLISSTEYLSDFLL